MIVPTSHSIKGRSILQPPIPDPRPQSDLRKQSDSHIVELIPALRAFARTFCRDKADADDLVQETLAKGIANLDKFEPGTRMKSWLFTIMRNTFYTRVKINRREMPGLAACASSRPTAEATQEWSVRGHEVHEAINRLPEHQREVLVLIGVLGVSYEEAAQICHCAVGTIKSRLNRARAGMLEEMGEESSHTLVESAPRLAPDQYDPDERMRR
jgi:RNA polymerase sigma-70 factor (ECF subfamily)